MHSLGMHGMPRRVAMYDPQFTALNQLCTFGAFMLAASLIPFIINAVWSWTRGPKAGDNPWNALTLEWTTASPPIIENWEVLPVVKHGPYEYGMTEEALAVE
jgi:cytochrome c oxidase subunit 1